MFWIYIFNQDAKIQRNRLQHEAIRGQTVARVPLCPHKNGWKSRVRSEGVFNRNHPRKINVVPCPFILLTSVNDLFMIFSGNETGKVLYNKWEHLNQKTNPKLRKQILLPAKKRWLPRLRRTPWEHGTLSQKCVLPLHGQASQAP